ncbi:beta-lactamase/transpeptidase-like protein [Aspergillus pseudonomiae]|uniref:Beta-lactamase/transpeptidase-like protein n=1 Tax=Aspergillus pseudonomiae TaxID=1506151 RepID=A0A5N7D6S8_9EURO|nr:beta-lactamase/transpeptidase-like protein [Aspergillus pseudonomiae]KAB8262171.1 beta-lactamase/transpeptidase-like protein [Aspergillus pseudonomiae]KAE8401603.1 beta-lactamase/transpeptidase-like protein [Aspergillus pseudonomiae]
MQLVEQGKLALGDAFQLDRLAPELKELKVLTRDSSESYTLVPQERRITLRMLMTHTAGFGHAFDDVKLSDCARPTGIDDFSRRREDVLLRPPVFQPGTGFQYGVSIDWVGVIIERATKTPLEEYFQTYIFSPLGVKDIAFYTTQTMKQRLVYMHQRAADGVLSVTDQLLRHTLVEPRYATNEKILYGWLWMLRDAEGVFENHGYAAQQRNLSEDERADIEVRNGTALVLTTPYVFQFTHTNLVLCKEIFTDQIPQYPIYHNYYCQSAKPTLANSCAIIPKPGNPTDGWGLTFMLSHEKSETGRAAGSASWEGLANLYWFADRVNGIAMIFATQILPYGDLEAVKLFRAIEKGVYASCGLTTR